LRAIPDILIDLVVEQFDILAGQSLGYFAWAKVVEAGRRASSHAHTTFVATVKVVSKAGIRLNLQEEPLFLAIGDLGVPIEFRRSM
jgi:hypothetical protein